MADIPGFPPSAKLSRISRWQWRLQALNAIHMTMRRDKLGELSQRWEPTCIVSALCCTVCCCGAAEVADEVAVVGHVLGHHTAAHGHRVIRRQAGDARIKWRRCRLDRRLGRRSG